MTFPLNTTIITLTVLIILIAILVILVINLHLKLKKFLVGVSSKNLDESIDHIKLSIIELERFRKDMEEYLLSVEKRLKKSVQAVHTIRFNPFKGTGSGGNQSFATTFLNEEGNGVVISSIYSREHTSVFSKPVKNGISEYELSQEEKQAIDDAKKLIK